MATTKKKRSFDAAFKFRVVEYAEQDTNRGAGRKFGVDEKNCSRSRIVAPPYYGMKILVAAASDRANTVYVLIGHNEIYDLTSLKLKLM